MEAISNAAAAAAKVVWGENEEGKEPTSGEQGDTSKGEPYDAGNIESSERKSDVPGTKETSTDQKDVETDEVSPKKDNPTVQDGVETDEVSPDKQKPTVQDDVETDEVSPDKQKPTVQDGVETDEVSPDKQKPTVQDGVETDEVSPKKDDRTKDDLEGPGPKPLQTLAKEHGGDAGQSSSQSNEKIAASSEDAGQKSTDSNNQGTGEEYVKTSGFVADGGDFDASNPGAGREADRLLEKKGIRPDKAHDDTQEPNNDDKDAKKEKGSLKDRIKAKFQKK